MKESVTKFDLESAFKALDEIDIPVADQGIRANRPALTEIFSRKSKFDSLFEEYYDIGTTDGLDGAKEAREAEVAKAKLERIEKIVDLDAESPEDLLTSYVGKYIMQCPQCMTLFYKDKEDIVESEEDPNTVNVNEICQHCGNESGYTLVGKVGEAEAENAGELPTDLEATEADEIDLEMPTEEPTEDDLEIDLDAINLDEEPAEEEEKTEEAFVVHTGESLIEDIQEDKDLDAKLEAHNEYIEYLRTAISQEEAALEKATNEQVKVAIQRNIDAFKIDLEAALPDAVKNDEAIAESTTEDTTEDTVDEMPVEEAPVKVEEVVESLTESLQEEADLEVSAEEFEELINSPEFKKPISDTAARAMIDAENEEEDVKESAEAKEETDTLEEGIFDTLKLTRSSKAEWVLNNALVDYEKAVVDKNGGVETSKDNKLFNVFVILCLKPDGNGGFVRGTKYADVKTKYKDAENIAKGWSMKSDGGPAEIYLTKSADAVNGVFLCKYINGKLDTTTDKLDEIINTIKKDQKGSKLRVKGGTDQSETRQIAASNLKQGMQIKVDDTTTGEVVKVAQSKSKAVKNQYVVSIKYADGKTENERVDGNYEFTVVRDSIKNESLATIMHDVDELQEAVLESLISDSLVKTYGNVAGYRLTNCSYINESLNIAGTIYFTSGNTRKTTYSFYEAGTENDKVTLIGLNEKLGHGKQFELTCSIKNKTLITESFGRK